MLSEIIIGRKEIKKSNTKVYVALVPTTKDIFPSVECEHFQQLLQCRKSDRVSPWYRNEYEFDDEDYYNNIVEGTETARASGKFPIPVAILMFRVVFNNPAASSTAWQVVGYFGCRKFKETSCGHTVGIFMHATHVPLGSDVVALACRLWQEQIKTYACNYDWPQALYFQTKVSNFPVYAMLREVLNGFPSFVIEEVEGYDPERIEFCNKDPRSIRALCEWLGDSLESFNIADVVRAPSLDAEVCVALHHQLNTGLSGLFCQIPSNFSPQRGTRLQQERSAFSYLDPERKACKKIVQRTVAVSCESDHEGVFDASTKTVPQNLPKKTVNRGSCTVEYQFAWWKELMEARWMPVDALELQKRELLCREDLEESCLERLLTFRKRHTVFVHTPYPTVLLTVDTCCTNDRCLFAADSQCEQRKIVRSTKASSHL